MKTKHVSRRLRRFLEANEAVSALEYAVLVGVVVIAVGGAIVTFSGDVKTAVENIGDGLAVTTNKVKAGETIDPTP